jgi:hypothetical protein
VLPFGRPASDTASEAGRREKLVVSRHPPIEKKSSLLSENIYLKFPIDIYIRYDI